MAGEGFAGGGPVGEIGGAEEPVGAVRGGGEGDAEGEGSGGEAGAGGVGDLP